MKKSDLQQKSQLFPPINNGSIKEIYPWNGFFMDILCCIFYPFNKLFPINENIIFDFFKTKNICLVDSGKSAIFLALKSLNVGVGDEVILSSFNCPAVIEPILSIGAVPKFIDINDKCGICLDSLNKEIATKTKCVIVTNIYGIVDDLESISTICKNNDLFLINDLSQVLENPSYCQKFNKYGDVSVYSFGQEKHLFAVGGGAVVSHNQMIFEKIKSNLPLSSVPIKSCLNIIFQRLKYYRTFFIYKNFIYIAGIMSFFGITYRFGNKKTVEINHRDINIMLMNGLQKKVLARKLKSFNKIISANIENFSFIKANIKFPLLDGKRIIPLYATILVDENDRFFISDYLSKMGVLTVWNYLPLYKATNKFVDSCYLPNTEKTWKNVLSIPFRYPIKKDRIAEICKIVNSYAKN